MKLIDPYSYQCGIIDCFNEMIRAGLKRIALSHPTASVEERDALIPFSREICQKYGTYFYVENEPLLTDLFPVSLNRGTYHIVFWKKEDDWKEYLSIKSDKNRLLQQNSYTGAARTEIAYRFGRLLSYPEEGIRLLIQANQELE